jgi:RNA polymerase sigma-70 factor, ECF subfamily
MNKVERWRQLATAAQNGDRQSANLLFAEILNPIRRSARSVSLWSYREMDADDLTQIGLIAILKGLPSYKSNYAFGKWSVSVATRAMWRACRRVNREMVRQIPENFDVPSKFDEPDQSFTEVNLTELDPRERAVLRLRFDLEADGMNKFSRIGRELGITPDQARQTVRQAINKLQAV